MQEFLTQYYTGITYLVEFIAALIGVIFYRHYKHTPVKYLVYFLVCAFLIDFIGYYPGFLRKLNLIHLIEDSLIFENYWWYNIFWNLTLTGFVTIINYKILKKELFKKVIKYCYLVYLVLFFLYAVVNFKFLFLPETTFLSILSLWLIALCISVYFVTVLQSDEIIHFYKSIYFYINSLILLWSLITAPLQFYELYFDGSDMDFVVLKWSIYLISNFIFYFTFTILLIWSKKQVR